MTLIVAIVWGVRYAMRVIGTRTRFARKPHSVSGDHLSSTCVAAGVKQHTRRDEAAR